MACPFLKEGRARYCHAAPVQKLILDGPGAADGGRCASPQYGGCELVAKNSVPQDRCPHLEEIRVQYCGVSPVTKLVPFSDSAAGSHVPEERRSGAVRGREEEGERGTLQKRGADVAAEGKAIPSQRA